MEKLAELICGAGYRPDWTAISAVATAAAVFIALWIPARDRRARHVEKLESEARAAELVSQSLSGLVEIMPNVIAKIRDMDGVMLDAPGNEIMYGTDECQAFIEREAFVHQLPTTDLGAGELTISLARRWCAQIAMRFEIQRSDELRRDINWKEHSFVCSLGEQLHASAVQLRDDCRMTKARYQAGKQPLMQRQLRKLRFWKGQRPGRAQR